MIVVKSVEIIDSGDINDRYEYWNRFKLGPLPDDFIKDEDIFKEAIEGRYFTWFLDGERHEVCIGWSNEVQKALGLPFEVFNKQEEALLAYRALLHKYEGMGFWQRLKFLFKGKP